MMDTNIVSQVHTDIDIDVKDRDIILGKLKYIPAIERYTPDGDIVPHKSGVFFDNIPHDPSTGYASIPYKDAEALGYQKVDFLNVHVYDSVRDRQHLVDLSKKEPRWELFKVPEFVGNMFQLGNQVTTVINWAPTNIHQLAMLIAMIRPAKRHLQGYNSWTQVEKEIWVKPTDGKAYFKRAHAYAYALAIIVQLNATVEILENDILGIT